MFRAQRRRGGLSFQSKLIPQWSIQLLTDRIRVELQNHDIGWHQDMYFLLTVRGTKHSSKHRKTQDAASRAFQDFLDEADLDMETVQSGNWWIDVGVEVVSEDGGCLQWRTSFHTAIVEEVLGISEDHARRITSTGSSKYARDLASHLTAVSGCRIEPGAQAAGQYEACYLQLYTTDKSVTYHPEGYLHAKAMTVQEAMGNNQPPNFVQGLFNTYLTAAANNPSNARLEMRVPVKYACDVLLLINSCLLREALLCFTRPEWW